ncbi:glycosyltransferase family 2 protein [Henriciella algicola]|uniref:Glycosyltransferase family 2 protein n=1 Tax=Henriciella algicola TaxID=1608422 RepID=A0A399RAV3_9PROT|nr:glycosyltransferase family 2 protein [Henriciella algicola]RIJ27774.1 glycosyltransferase family 2 protein [Henriciella algicola]
MTGDVLTVVIPTYNRPDSLRRAVESLFWQGAARSGFRLIVADNSVDATARLTFDTLAEQAPDTLTLTYLHVPEAGVANARNAAMKVLETPLIAFLDDDQAAPTHWIEELLAAYKTFGAAVTFGPVQTVLPDDITKHRAYYENFFAREPNISPGYIEKPFGCGNCLIDARQVPMKGQWFDARMNEVGGEDDLLFQRIRANRGKFAWAPNAPVFEYPLRQRISLSYTLRRAFAYGQGPATLARKRQPPRYDLLLFWVLVGGGKFALHSLRWLALRLIGHKNRAFEADQAVRGLGKIFFWIKLRFYGTSTVTQFSGQPVASAGEHTLTVKDGRAGATGSDGLARR